MYKKPCTCLYRRTDGSERSDNVWSSVSSSWEASDSVVSSLRQCQTWSMGVVTLHQPLGLRRAARLACTFSLPPYLLYLFVSSSARLVLLMTVRRLLELRVNVNVRRLVCRFRVSLLRVRWPHFSRSHCSVPVIHVFADDRITLAWCALSQLISCLQQHV